eukprot:CAMPEP_0119478656 /NCGR_PEP_ID=MMETSP1344-20130328/8292_1 /TAXON_ID=236787 /ORGANISM="Florenciella parvula, Strain CCMP2471" /LENGTH=323 /DNA_ID=CAMNT_0007512843 /DNA_START=93 /DNA_END=1064 /DNA_ORIENTATION=+
MAMMVGNIQLLNIANLAFYCLNLLLIYLSITGIFGETNTALSSKYQTLVTPSGWAFSIWGPIFIFEGVFAVCQLLPSYRDSAVVQQGVSYWWIYVCVMQIAWTMGFAQEQIVLSTVFMYGILVGLVAIVYRTNVLHKAQTYSSWWLTKAPFTLHLGWIIVATLLSNNVTVVAAGASPATQLAWAAYTLALLTAIGGLVVFGRQPDSSILVGVFTWALGAVASELTDPIDAEQCEDKTGKADGCNMLSEMYAPSITNGLSGACAALSVTMLVILVGLVAVAAVRAVMAPPEEADKEVGLAEKAPAENGATDEENPSQRAVSVEG